MLSCEKPQEVLSEQNWKSKDIFKSYATKDKVMKQRKNLKGSNVFINEDLIARRAKLFYEARLLK